MDNQPYLSVIIPAYKEGERIGRTLREIEKYFHDVSYDWEVIVIVDGSHDHTSEIAFTYAGRMRNLRVIENRENHGKGYVVRQGLLEANGKIRLFMDADGSTSIDHLDTFLPEFKNGHDVVIGSRNIEGAFIQVHQAKYKEIMGDVGNWMIRIVLGLWSFPDTQCGFKMMTDKAAEAVVSRMVIDRFGVDYELIKLSKDLGFIVKQLPVRWLNEEGSTVTLTGPNGYLQVFIDLLKTKWRLMTGKYNLKSAPNENG
jgi:dolichyl-phosphate beta-glucosyltransferase